MNKFSNKFSIIFSILILLATTLSGQIFNDSLSSKLQKEIDQFRNQSQFTGISAAIISDEYGSWTGVSGYSQESNNKQITTDMLFGIGSITKTYIATLVMQLEDEGILSINDSLYHWLSSYPNIDSTITIKQLLKHESGIFNLTDSPLFFEVINQDPLHVWQDEEIILTLIDKPIFKPGERYSYSNSNYILLGMILKKATDKSISTLLKQRILGPLDLNHTFMAIEDALEGNVAHGWLDVDGDSNLDDFTAFMPRNAFYSSLWTAGAMFATAENAAIFMKALFNGELVSANSLDKMTDINATTNNGLGLFGFVTPNNISMMGHDGFTLEYSAFTYYDVSSKSTFSVLVNQRDQGSKSMSLIFKMLKVLTDFVPASITASKIAAPIAQTSVLLDQNWPNPFNSSTNISFTLQKAGFVQLDIYSLLGEKIKTIVNGSMVTGKHNFIWNGENDYGRLVTSGTYIMHLQSGQVTETKKLMLVH